MTAEQMETLRICRDFADDGSDTKAALRAAIAELEAHAKLLTVAKEIRLDFKHSLNLGQSLVVRQYTVDMLCAAIAEAEGKGT